MTDGLIANGNWDTFLTLDREELLLVRRKHMFVVIWPILFTSLFTLLLIAISLFFFLTTFYSIPFLIISILLLISISLSVITKTIIDWYFHVYIVTSRKILEFCYTPLASHVKTDVLLDKVNCTEVDVQVHGLINELIDIGDVIITFDRPTHQDSFVFKDIKDGDKIGKFLTQKLIDHEVQNPMQPIWFRRHTNQGGRWNA